LINTQLLFFQFNYVCMMESVIWDPCITFCMYTF